VNPFHDRIEAAHELARDLLFLKTEDPIVLGIANPGVVVAEIVAQAINAPLDVMLIDRIAAPDDPTRIVGAVDEHGRTTSILPRARWQEGIGLEIIEPARKIYQSIRHRRARLRAVLPELDVTHRTVVIVDHGITTGAKMLAAVTSLIDRDARKIVAAAPVAEEGITNRLREIADLLVVPRRLPALDLVADAYENFPEIPDDHVQGLVERWVRARPYQRQGVTTLAMKLHNDLGHMLAAEIDLPPGCTRGTGPYPAVIFAHGFESDSRSHRTLILSRRLAKRGIIGVRIDFTGHGQSEGSHEAATTERMYNDLKILLQTTRSLDEVDNDRIGVVGSGSGSTLALKLAADERALKALVIRGPMRGTEIGDAMLVASPTLMIYGGEETWFDEKLNEKRHQLPDVHRNLMIPHATRIFNDSVSLDVLTSASLDWLTDHLAPGATPIRSA